MREVTKEQALTMANAPKNKKIIPKVVYISHVSFRRNHDSVAYVWISPRAVHQLHRGKGTQILRQATTRGTQWNSDDGDEICKQT